MVQQILDGGIQFIIFVQSLRTPVVDVIMRGVSVCGAHEFYLFVLPVMIILSFFSVRLNKRVAIRIVAAVLLAYALNSVIKEIIHEPRPSAMHPELAVEGASGYGFPSGHAMVAAVFWSLVPIFSGRAWRWLFMVLPPLLIGFSRVYLGVHYPTDVVAGWIFGIAIVFAVKKFDFGLSAAVED